MADRTRQVDASGDDVVSALLEYADALDREDAVSDQVRSGPDKRNHKVSRQPVHTVCVPADQFTSTTALEWGTRASELLDAQAPDAVTLASATNLPLARVAEVYDAVRHKLATEPIEDLRIDFEDNFPRTSDAEEDEAATSAAQALVGCLTSPCAPAQYGIRIKSLEPSTRRRGIRTLAVFMAEFVRHGDQDRPVVVTMPKATTVQAVETFVKSCNILERMLHLRSRTILVELQIELPRSIVDATGNTVIPRMISASDGRCVSLHYGTHDYSAACDIAPGYQTVEHPAADHAKAVIQAAAAGTGVFLSDGSTNILPVGDRPQIYAAWQLHARLVRRSLERGYYQGWDMHPAHLPTRFLATYLFYREGLASTGSRLADYTFSHSDQLGYLEEPATAAALARFMVRGVECGAVREQEAISLSGLSLRQLADLARFS